MGREGLLALLLQGRGRERALVVPDKLGKGGLFLVVDGKSDPGKDQEKVA